MSNVAIFHDRRDVVTVTSAPLVVAMPAMTTLPVLAILAGLLYGHQ